MLASRTDDCRSKRWAKNGNRRSVKGPGELSLRPLDTPAAIWNDSAPRQKEGRPTPTRSTWRDTTARNTREKGWSELAAAGGPSLRCACHLSRAFLAGLLAPHTVSPSIRGRRFSTTRQSQNSARPVTEDAIRSHQHARGPADMTGSPHCHPRATIHAPTDSDSAGGPGVDRGDHGPHGKGRAGATRFLRPNTA